MGFMAVLVILTSRDIIQTRTTLQVASCSRGAATIHKPENTALGIDYVPPADLD